MLQKFIDTEFYRLSKLFFLYLVTESYIHLHLFILYFRSFSTFSVNFLGSTTKVVLSILFSKNQNWSVNWGFFFGIQSLSRPSEQPTGLSEAFVDAMSACTPVCCMGLASMCGSCVICSADAHIQKGQKGSTRQQMAKTPLRRQPGLWSAVCTSSRSTTLATCAEARARQARAFGDVAQATGVDGERASLNRDSAEIRA